VLELCVHVIQLSATQLPGMKAAPASAAACHHESVAVVRASFAGMKRFILAVAIGYVVLGLITRGMEAAGAYECGCDPECWCKKPGLSLFRWVFPRWHKGEWLSPERKRMLDA
jgi:hypothetical protein